MEKDPPEVALEPTEEQLDRTGENGQRKGKRKPEGDIVDNHEVDEQNLEAPPKAKRSKRSERTPAEPRARPTRERRQSSYSISRGFLDDKAFESMEIRSSKIEQRRAAFYDTQSYHGEVAVALLPNKMSGQEKEAFPRCTEIPELAAIYLRHRTGILERYAEFAPEYMQLEDYVMPLTEKQYTYLPGEIRMIKRIWKFLRVNGRINVDHAQQESFEADSPETSDTEYADVSGHAAAPTTKSTKSRSRSKATSESPEEPAPAITVQNVDSEPTNLDRKDDASEQAMDDKRSEASDSQPPAVARDLPQKPPKSRAAKSQALAAASESKPESAEGEVVVQKTPKARGAKNAANLASPPGNATTMPGTPAEPASAPRRTVTRAARRRKEDDPIPSAWAFGSLIPPNSNLLDASSLRVCIVGAGIAGLAAAQCLHQHGVHNVRVLESRSRIGGRVFTANANGANLELGAQFIQSHTLNPIIDLCQQLNLHTYATSTETCPDLNHLFSSTPLPFPIIAPIEAINTGEAVPYVPDEDELDLEELSQDEDETGQHETLATSSGDIALGPNKGSRNGMIISSQESANSTHEKAPETQTNGDINGHQSESLHASGPIPNGMEHNDMPSPNDNGCVPMDESLNSISMMDISQEIASPRLVVTPTPSTVSSATIANGSDTSPLKEVVSPTLNHLASSDPERTQPQFRWKDLMTFGARTSEICTSEDMYCHEYSSSQAVVSEGLSEVIRNLAIGIDVWLACRVHGINYNPHYRNDTVLVRYTDAYQQERNETYDVVLVTAPLGVLKSGSLQFSPPLPPSKQESINRVQVGHQNKIHLLFSRNFWSSGSEATKTGSERRFSPSHRVVWEDENLGIVVLSSPILFGAQPILQVIWSGEAAATMHSVDPKACVDAIVSKLKEAFSSSTEESEPQLEGFLWAPWSNDPHCFGAHSFIPVGEHPSLRIELAEPIHCGRIGFAGEHTHQAHHSTLHGAFESGIREARRIIDSFTQQKVGNLVYPFNEPLLAQFTTDLPWKTTTEEQEEANEIQFLSLPKISVRVNPVEMDVPVDVV